MKNKIAILGLGQVGTTILYNLFLTGTNLEVILIDNHLNRSRGNILDLNHCLNNQVKIKQGNYKDLDDVDILIISTSVKYSKSRITFLQDSYLMIHDIMENINKTDFKGNIIVVSNPNDVLTTYVSKNYRYPEKVMGTGTFLDTNRLKYYLSEKYHVSSGEIDARIIGEHGDSQVILFEDIKIENQKIKLTKEEQVELENKVINIAHEIVDLKGYTNYGVTNCVLKIINAILNDTNEVINLSNYDSVYQIAYSYPVVITNQKLKRLDNLNYEQKLKKSIEKIQKEYKIFSNNIIIGIDLDDTITDIRDSMHNEAFKYAQKNGLKIIDDTKYLVGEKYGFTKQQLDEFFLNYRLNIVENAKIREDAKEILTKLLNLGYKIIIITARSFKYYSNPYEYTKNWLDLNQIPYTKIIVEGKDKKEICKQENVSIFIDDMPSNCQEVSELDNVKVFIMDNVDNYLDDDKIKRIYNFKDLYKEIRK